MPSQYTIDGERVPSVGRILKANGFGPPPQIPLHILQAAAERGNRVHSWLDGIHQGEHSRTDFPVAEDARPYVDAYWRFRDDVGSRWVVLESEQIVTNTLYRYSGRLDVVASLDGCKGVYDFKCSVKIGPEVRLQLCGYGLCIEPDRAIDRYALQLKRNGTYELHGYNAREDAGDFDDWLACVRVAHFCLRHGIEREGLDYER